MPPQLRNEVHSTTLKWIAEYLEEVVKEDAMKETPKLRVVTEGLEQEEPMSPMAAFEAAHEMDCDDAQMADEEGLKVAARHVRLSALRTGEGQAVEVVIADAAEGVTADAVALAGVEEAGTDISLVAFGNVEHLVYVRD